MTDWTERPDPYLSRLERAPGAPHYNSWTGRPCTCPWGARRAQNVRTAGQQVNKLLKAPDKAFRTPEGMSFLQAITDLTNRFPEADDLAPFIAQRWKKGEIKCHHGMLWDDLGTPVDNRVSQWADWYRARQHPSRRGVNVMDPNFTVDDLRAKVNEHQAELERQRAIEEGLSHGQVHHKFENGWHVRHLTAPGTDTGEALYQEGRHMGHCIGDAGQNYQELARQGLIDVYSLRDPKGWPHGTWHTNPNGTIAEVHGNADRGLSPEQDEMYEEWCQANGYDPEPYGTEEDPYDQEIQLSDPDDIPSYLAQYGDEAGDWESYMPQDANWGENTEVFMGDPNHSSIAQHIYTSQDPVNPTRWFPGSPMVQRQVFNAALDSGHLDQLHSAMMDYPIDEPWEQDVQDRWKSQYNEHVHPQTGEFIHPRWNSEQGRFQPITELIQPRLIQPDWSTNWGWSQAPRRQNPWENTPGWTYSRRQAKPWSPYGQWESPPTPKADEDADWYYHASPRTNRDAILREGLRPPGEGMEWEEWYGDDPEYPDRTGDPGEPPDYETDLGLELYAADHPNGAHAFMNGSNTPYDVWAFQVPKSFSKWHPHDYMQGYDDESKSYTGVNDENGEPVWAHTGVVRVPPEHLKLHTPWEENPRNQERVAHVPEDHKHRETDLYSATDYLEDNRYRKRVTS